MKDLNDFEHRIKNVAQQLEEISNKFTKITNDLDKDIYYRDGLEYQTHSLSAELNKAEDKVYCLGHFIKSSVEEYNEAESQLSSQVSRLLAKDGIINFNNENLDTTRINNTSDKFSFLFGDKIIKSCIEHLVSFFSNIGQKTNNQILKISKSNYLDIANTYLQENVYRGLACSIKISIYDAPILWDYDFATIMRLNNIFDCKVYACSSETSKLEQYNYEPKKEEKGFWEEVWGGVVDSVYLTGDFFYGMAEGAWESVEGIGYIISHPVKTCKAGWQAISHPIKTGEALWDAVTTTINNEYIHGTDSQRARFNGKIAFEIIAAIVGTKGLDKLAKSSKVADKISDTAKILKNKVTKGIGSKVDEVIEKLSKVIDDLADLGIDTQENINRAKKLKDVGVTDENIVKVIKEGKSSSSFIQKKILDLDDFKYLNESQRTSIMGAINDGRVDISKWTGKVSGELKDMTREEWIAIDKYMSKGKSISRIAETGTEKVADFVVDGVSVEFKGLLTKTVDGIENKAFKYARESFLPLPNGKNADCLVIDCVTNGQKITIEQATKIANKIKNEFPKKKIEIWTSFGDVVK